jgi:hypothetical protein
MYEQGHKLKSWYESYHTTNEIRIHQSRFHGMRRTISEVILTTESEKRISFCLNEG